MYSPELLLQTWRQNHIEFLYKLYSRQWHSLFLIQIEAHFILKFSVLFLQCSHLLLQLLDLAGVAFCFNIHLERLVGVLAVRVPPPNVVDLCTHDKGGEST